MSNYGNLFYHEHNNRLIDEAGFNQYILQMSVYYKYSPNGSKLVVLSYVDDFVYWYTSEELGKWFVCKLGNLLHVIFLVYAHCFMPIRISKLEYPYISVDQSRYTTSVVENYLYTN